MSEGMANNKFTPWPMTEPAYTEQDLQRTHELIVEAMKKLGSVAGAGYWPVAKVVAAEFSRIRSEARAGMREACAKHYPGFVGFDDVRVGCNCGYVGPSRQDNAACIEDWEAHIRSLSDLAADEAIERIKAKAMFHEHVTTCKECFYLGESLQTPCARRLQLEQRIAALSGKEPSHDQAKI